jgi:hypothetical protein
VGLVYMPATHRAMVYDGYIKFVYGHPVEAQITDDTQDHLRLTWEVRNLPARTNHGARVDTDLRYRGNFVKGADRLILLAQLDGYENPPSQGQYDCQQK